MAVRLKGWRFGVFIGSFVSSIGLCLYFTAVRPMINPEPYRNIRDVVLPNLPPKV